MHIYIRNIDTNEFLRVRVNPSTNEIIQGLPPHWASKPDQFVRWPGGRAYATTAGGEMPGWLFRLIRRGYGLSQKQLGAMLYKAHTTISYYENQPQIPKVMRKKIYAALKIDHRPGVMNPATIKRIHEFLGVTWCELAAILRVSTSSLQSWAYGKSKIPDQGLNALYMLYCLLPDMSEGMPCLGE